MVFYDKSKKEKDKSGIDRTQMRQIFADFYSCNRGKKLILNS